MHAGETIIVCGCGSSLKALPEPESLLTIGVNDVGRLFDPTYLVVLNMQRQFKGNRFSYIEQSRAKTLFAQLDLGIKHPNQVRFKLGKRGGTDCSDATSLPYTRNSPYVALCLAIYMGAKRIGLIGVDFTDHHFFGQTGSHPLSRQLTQINGEFKALNAEAETRGIEIVNLSPESRISAFSKSTVADFCNDAAALPVSSSTVDSTPPRVFCVNYRFLACGDVFTTGLQHAADELGLNYQATYWDDPQLANKIKLFAPDLLLVVHGRKFVQKWRSRIQCKSSAVWLLDEPYEVDDSAKYARYFDQVFVNDPNSIPRHENAHYLPVAIDPLQHNDDKRTKKYQVGFVGGYNQTRERFLLRLLDSGHLSYVVGGPWKDRRLQSVCLARNVSPQETAELYRQTRIVVNVFRDIHHFNKNNIPGHALNPRIYEALACGALVVSESRPEVAEVFPALPVFSSASELVEKVGHYLDDTSLYDRIRQECVKQLAGHTYRDRLQKIVEVCMSKSVANRRKSVATVKTPESTASVESGTPADLPQGWSDHGGIITVQADNSIVLNKDHDAGAGSELGLASMESFQNVELSFDVRLGQDACFIAKIHQQSRLDQATNSHHLMCQPGHSYLAMHNHIFKNVQIRYGRWQKITLRHRNNYLELLINNVSVFGISNNQLTKGYCFIGIKGGHARVKNINLGHCSIGEKQEHIDKTVPDFTIEQEFGSSFEPSVSIVTTVYDRVECLGNCLQSVNGLQYRDFEHIVVADHPPDDVFGEIRRLVRQQDNGRIELVNLGARHNDWGIAPASAGLSLARGRYVCFLSDDNGYTPDHFNNLVTSLNRDNGIGFAYSSCRYDGRLVLRSQVPRPGGIDLGQPLFRRELFDRYFNGGLPFDMMAWDWHMIETLMKHSVRWKHINKPTFLFRLDKYLSEQRQVAS